MAYIGNAKAPLIFAANVRDDITAELDGNGQWKAQFLLSQEVPGGNENSIMVVARRIIYDPLVVNTTAVSITKVSDPLEPSGYRAYITTSDETLASALNVVNASNSYRDGDAIQIDSSTNPSTNNQTINIINKTYSGDNISLELEITDLTEEENQTLSLTRVHYGPWEILDPERDYTIVDTTNKAEYNRLIEFKNAPKEGDIIYVLHRGEATYNFVPSAKSVGPDQLQDNLRDFVCDRHVVGSGGESTFALSRDAVNSKTIMVTVDGQIKDGDDLSVGYDQGEWTLATDLASITFKTPVPEGAKVKILHLGFSTVSRRSSLSVSVSNLVERSVKTEHLDYLVVTTNRIANNAVTNDKISNDTITASKLLLENSEDLRQKNSSGTAKNILGLSSSNLLSLQNQDGAITLSAQSSINLRTSTNIENGLTVSDSGQIGINTNSPSHMLHLSGNSPRIELTNTDTAADSHISATNASGSLVISADENNEVADTQVIVRVDGADAAYINSSANNKLEVVGAIKATDVISPLINGVPVSQVGSPTGTIVMFGGAAAPEGWLLCDGAEYDGTTPTHQALYQVLGNAYGGSAPNFKVPDMRRRFPVGQDISLANPALVGANEGLPLEARFLSHKHVGAPHTHHIGHTHIVPGHRHEHSSISSTLEINESGSHETNLTHTHDSVNSSDPKILSGGTPVDHSLSHVHDHTHSHTTKNNGAAFYTEDDSPDHTHTGATSPGSDGAHTHTYTINYQTNATNTDSSTQTRLKGTDAAGTTRQNTTAIVFNNSGGHSHNIATGGASVRHKHLVVIADDRTKTTSTPRNPTNSALAKDLTHFHTISGISFAGNVVGGLHTHDKTTISGSIGYAKTEKALTLSAAAESQVLSLTSVNEIFVGSTLTQIGATQVNLRVVAISGNSVTLNLGIPANVASGTSVIFSSANGNENLTTTSQNNSTSGPAAFTDLTSEVVLPHLVVNFIIKL